MAIIITNQSSSSSSSAATVFNFSNNVSSFTDVTGFLVNPSTSQAFTASISIQRTTSGNDYMLTTHIDGIYYSTTGRWFINQYSSTGDAQTIGIAFEMTSAGQLQYTSSNLSGTAIINQMKFLIGDL